MDDLDFLQRFSVALAIGVIIGLERGWQARDHPEGGRAAGFGTHALGALLGATWGAIAQSTELMLTFALGVPEAPGRNAIQPMTGALPNRGEHASKQEVQRPRPRRRRLSANFRLPQERLPRRSSHQTFRPARFLESGR